MMKVHAPSQRRIIQSTLRVLLTNFFLAASFLTLAGNGFVPTAQAQQGPLPPVALERVRTFFADRISGRYMEQNCESTTFPGWEGLPLQKCTYSVKGRKDPVKKTAKVIMLNASPDQLARWVVATCIEVTGSAAIRCTRKLSQQINGQSNAQFPIAGIVFEDILPKDGREEAFAFRNGVTVRVNGVRHLGTHQPTPGEIEKSLNAPVMSALRFARIQSTTREQYQANGGQRPVQGLAWLEVTRDSYKAAFGNDRNELMIAWARANASRLR